MGRWLVIALMAGTLALIAIGCGETTHTVTTTEPAVADTGDLVLFGYAKEMDPDGDRYRLRFDPVLVLSGETASVAAAEDGVVEPGEPVPNDYYRVDESKRLFTYLVPGDARVTVLRDAGVQPASISVDELAQLVAGEEPFGKPLWEPISTGFRMRIHVDTVRSLEQLYVP